MICIMITSCKLPETPIKAANFGMGSFISFVIILLNLSNSAKVL